MIDSLNVRINLRVFHAEGIQQYLAGKSRSYSLLQRLFCVVDLAHAAPKLEIRSAKREATQVLGIEASRPIHVRKTLIVNDSGRSTRRTTSLYANPAIRQIFLS